MLDLTQAQPVCYPLSEPAAAQVLATQFGEGEEARREGPTGTLVLYHNAEKHTWTIVFYPRGEARACPIGDGEGNPPSLDGTRGA